MPGALLFDTINIKAPTLLKERVRSAAITEAMTFSEFVRTALRSAVRETEARAVAAGD